MNEKELKELQSKIEAEQKKQTEEIERWAKASESQKTELNGKIEESEKKIQKLEADKDVLSKQLDAIQLQMKDTRLQGKSEDPYAEMKAALTNPEVRAQIKDRKQVTFEVKVSQIDLATELSNGTTDLSAAVVIPFREPGVVKAPDRPTTLLDIVGRQNLTSNRVAWVERTARTDGISTSALAAIVEGAIYKQSDFTWAQKFAPVEKIGTYVKCTNETLEDWDQLRAQITDELVPMVERALELEVYSGTGTSPQMQGITDVCAAYTLATITGVVTPNLIDVITAAVAQIRSAHFNGPLTALVNPVDYALATMPKNADGIYLMPPNFSGDRMSVSGCRIVSSTLVTAGDILVGDFTRDTLFTKRGITVQFFNQEASDAIYDLTTITASVRAVNRLALPDYDAFVYDAISDIATAIG
jgi:HK97 family phage major capsid protein